MKYFPFTISVLICLNAVFAIGQSQDSSKEYEKKVNDALSNLENISYKKKIQQDYTDNKPEVTNEKGERTSTNEKILIVKNTIIEFYPPNRQHKIETKNFKITGLTDSYFNENSYEETISINGKTFRKGNNDKWEEFDPNAGTFKNGPIIELGKDIVDYKFIGSKIINNQKISTYEMIANSKTNGSTIREKYWINSNTGLLIKEEYEANLYNGEKIIKSITKYEYDSTIKVELPK